MKRIFFYLLLFLVGIGVSMLSRSADISEEKKEMETIGKTLMKHKIEYFLFTNSQGNQFLVVPSFSLFL